MIQYEDIKEFLSEEQQKEIADVLFNKLLEAIKEHRYNNSEISELLAQTMAATSDLILEEINFDSIAEEISSSLAQIVREKFKL